MRPIARLILFFAAGCCLVALSAAAPGQEARVDTPDSPSALDDAAKGPAAANKVEVDPAAGDAEIQDRLERILRATGWFSEPRVQVEEGIAFLEGKTEHERYQEWAGHLARNTESVVAVVNHIDVVTPNPWDFSVAKQGFADLLRSIVRALPMIAIAVLVLLASWLLARSTRLALRRLLKSRLNSNLLREVTARAFGILVFLLGLYFVLRVSGLTRLAVTVIGGTGLVGLVLGIAFREISENFLASLFLSLQQPFRTGDLVEVAGITGYIQRLNSRTTVLATLDGNLVQIPNATVFKSTIRNFTSNANRRESFTVGIGYDDAIPRAQDVALGVLAEHPAVLRDPEPWVLVGDLGKATVNLQVYFWLDGSKHHWLKVRSSVIRLVKRAFQDAGISLPDEAREVIFPNGVPVRMLDPETRPDGIAGRDVVRPAEAESVSTKAEAGLDSDADEIQSQANRSWMPDHDENLLAADGSQAASPPAEVAKNGAGRGPGDALRETAR
jgi:small-conductance mechanosensitive channel